MTEHYCNQRVHLQLVHTVNSHLLMSSKTPGSPHWCRCAINDTKSSSATLVPLHLPRGGVLGLVSTAMVFASTLKQTQQRKSALDRAGATRRTHCATPLRSAALSPTRRWQWHGVLWRQSTDPSALTMVRRSHHGVTVCPSHRRLLAALVPASTLCEIECAARRLLTPCSS